MPLKSKSQQRWMFAEHPEMAKKWADETPDIKNLPEKVSKKEGGTIHIDPKNRGKFNATKKATGKSTEELTHSSNPTTRKRAIFAQNAKKWKHQEGGTVSEMGYRDDSPYKNRDSIDINTPSGLIDMSHTGTPLMANGVPLQPYSGLHQMGSKKVKEIPMKKKGKKMQNGGSYDDYINDMWGDNKLKPNIAPTNPDAPTLQPNPDYNPNQKPTATPEATTIDTSNMKAPTSGAKKVSKFSTPSGQSFSVGAGIGLVEGLITSLLGPEQPRRKIDNTLAYNPYPSGTGSQALFQDGGTPNPTIVPVGDMAVKRAKYLKEKVPNNYGKYSGVIDNDGSSILTPDYQKAMEINLEYMKNNTPDSNIYRLENTHHSVNTIPQPVPNDSPAYAKWGGKMKKCKTGANIMGNGGLQTYEGGKAPQISHNPFDGGSGEFQGDSHEDGGIDSSFNGKPFEAEGGEPYRLDQQGNLEIFGDLQNPITGNKFKKDGKIIASKEQKVQKYVDKGLDLVNSTDPTDDKWALMKFNSGSAMLKGGLAKQKELADSKEHLSFLQKLMLQNEPAKPNARNGGLIFQDGGTPWEYRGTNTTNLDKKIKGFVDLAQQKGLTGYSGAKSGFDVRNTSSGRPSRHGANQALDMMFKDKDAYNKILQDPDMSKYLYDNGLTAINEYDPSIAAKTGATTGHVHIGYDRGTPTSDQFRSDYKSIYSPKEEPSNVPSSISRPFKGANSGDAYTETPDPWTAQQRLNINRIGTNLSSTPYPDAPTFNFKNPPTTPFKAAKNGLPWEQIAPAIPQLFDKPDYVAAESYNPDLYTPYQVSFQDRVNNNSKTFNALAPSLVNNPEAQGVLAGELYSANNQVGADEFRTNQGISDDITNKNVSLLNDAKLKNIQLRDTQQVRQAQTLGNTRDRRTQAGIQIGDVLAKNKLENKTAAVYSQLYKDYAYDKNMQLQYVGDANAGDRLSDTGSLSAPARSTVTTKTGDTTTRDTYTQPSYAPVNLLDGYRKQAKGQLPISKIAKLMYPQ